MTALNNNYPLISINPTAHKARTFPFQKMESVKGIDTRWEKNILQYLQSQLYRWVIIRYINCGHQGGAMWGIEIAYERVLIFYFHFSLLA